MNIIILILGTPIIGFSFAYLLCYVLLGVQDAFGIEREVEVC